MTDKQREGGKCGICGDIHRARDEDRLPLDCDLCKHEIGAGKHLWGSWEGKCDCNCHKNFLLGINSVMSGYGFTLQYNHITT